MIWWYLPSEKAQSKLVISDDFLLVFVHLLWVKVS